MSGRPLPAPAAPPLPPEEPFSPFRPRAILVVAALALAAFLLPLPLPAAAHRTLVILVVAGGLWMTEALPVAVTALLVPLLGIALGVTDARGAFAGFGDPIVFLFFGTFLLTDASHQHGLNDRLARAVLAMPGVERSPSRLLWAIAFIGSAISGWVNNTATTALLVPLALTMRRVASPRMLSGILLMTAYAASIGGMATPVGTAPNLIGLRLLEQATGSRPSFAGWFLLFAPLGILATVLTAAWLAWRGRRAAAAAAPSAAAAGTAPAAARWTLAERLLVPLFGAVVLLWIAPGLLDATPLRDEGWVRAWRARLPEPAVPMLGGLLLFLLPSGRGRERILDAGVFRRLDWHTILLFGGGLSLGGMMFDSGLARAFGEGLFAAFPLPGTFGIVLAATLMAVVVSEITSNTASAALVVPVVLALAEAAGVDPVKPALAATVGCSFGFMLPVSTPPNALVYATGHIPIRAMIANGALLDAAGVLLVAVWVTLFA